MSFKIKNIHLVIHQDFFYKILLYTFYVKNIFSFFYVNMMRGKMMRDIIIILSSQFTPYPYKYFYMIKKKGLKFKF